jgi:hypothetical protein
MPLQVPQAQPDFLRRRCPVPTVPRYSRKHRLVRRLTPHGTP